MPWACTGSLCSASGWEQPRNDLSAHTLVIQGAVSGSPTASGLGGVALGGDASFSRAQFSRRMAECCQMAATITVFISWISVSY